MNTAEQAFIALVDTLDAPTVAPMDKLNAASRRPTDIRDVRRQFQEWLDDAREAVELAEFSEDDVLKGHAHLVEHTAGAAIIALKQIERGYQVLGECLAQMGRYKKDRSGSGQACATCGHVDESQTGLRTLAAQRRDPGAPSAPST